MTVLYMCSMGVKKEKLRRPLLFSRTCVFTYWSNLLSRHLRPVSISGQYNTRTNTCPIFVSRSCPQHLKSKRRLHSQNLKTMQTKKTVQECPIVYVPCVVFEYEPVHDRHKIFYTSKILENGLSRLI